VALVGGWMQTVAQSWLVLQLTDSPLRLGLVSTLQSAPVLLFCIPAGAIADRLAPAFALNAIGFAVVVAALLRPCATSGSPRRCSRSPASRASC
jgi:hypothetical protein